MEELSKEHKKNLEICLSLLCEENTNLSKVKKISTLLKSVSSKYDKQLDTITEIIEKIEAVQDGDIIGLSAEKLPEKTKEQKKRKKLLLLLLKNWGSLKSEVTRLNSLYNSTATAGALSKEATVKSVNILHTMKGPLGIITIAAAGIVAIGAFLNNRAVEINVKNEGCSPVRPVSERAIDVPGLHTFSDSIKSGSTDVMKLPGVKVDVSVGKTGSSQITLLGINKSFNLPYEYDDIIFDGESLMGKSSTIKLSKSKTHDLVIKCNN